MANNHSSLRIRVMAITIGLVFSIAGQPIQAQQACRALIEDGQYDRNDIRLNLNYGDAFKEAGYTAECTSLSTAVAGQNQLTTYEVSFIRGETGIMAYLKTLYQILVALSAFLAGLVIVWHGIMIVLAAGNPGKISKAKSGIKRAILGLALALLGYNFLSWINPDTVKLKLPRMETIDRVEQEVAKEQAVLDAFSDQQGQILSQVEKSRQKACVEGVILEGSVNQYDAKCGEKYTISKTSLNLPKWRAQFPDGKCYGTSVCDNQEQCVAREDSEGFVCSSQYEGAGTISWKPQIDICDVPKELGQKSTDLEIWDSLWQACHESNRMERVFQQTQESGEPKVCGIVKYDYSGFVEYQCRLVTAKTCGQEAVRLYCTDEGWNLRIMDETNQSLSLGLKQNTSKQCVSKHKCLNSKYVGEDSGGPEEKICCAQTGRDKNLSEIKKNYINCRANECHGDETEVSCSVWNKISTPYQDFGVETQCKDSINTPYVCCLELREK